MRNRISIRWALSSFVLVSIAVLGVRLLPTGGGDALAQVTAPPAVPSGAPAPQGQDRSVVQFDPSSATSEPGKVDDRLIYWVFHQFQLLDQSRADAQPASAPKQWMVDDQIQSAEEVAQHLKANHQSIRQQGGWEFVCYNADYLGGIQGRLASWQPDASSDDWIELNNLPKELEAKFTTSEVFPAPRAEDYATCASAVDQWNDLIKEA